MEKLFDILSEDEDLLILNKPAGLVCHPTKGDAYSSLISRVRLHLGSGPEPQLINRLDRETSGIVVVGKHPASALAARRIWESRQVEKDYWAIVHGDVIPDHDRIDAPLGKDERSAVVIKDTVRPDGAAAVTEFWVERRFRRQGADFTWLKVRPQTGRKHQIRIHLASRGHPIVGDKIYGADEQLYLAFVERRLTASDRQRLILENHALHARTVRFPWGAEVRTFEAEPEEAFRAFLGQA